MRQKFVCIPGAFYHVILRSATSEPLFFSPQDQRSFCLILQQWQKSFNHRIIAFCLMTNHVHLVLQAASPHMIASVHRLRYHYFHSIRARFSYRRVFSKSYLFELIRYVHMNPVKAGMVDSPEYYPWSSHRAYLGLDAYAWLHCGFILKHFIRPGRDPRMRFEYFITKGRVS